MPDHRQEYAGLVICLARDEWPDLSAYNDPEVVWRVPRANHAGLLLASPDPARVAALLEQYTDRFARDFLAHAPQTKQARTTL